MKWHFQKEIWLVRELVSAWVELPSFLLDALCQMFPEARLEYLLGDHTFLPADLLSDPVVTYLSFGKLKKLLPLHPPLVQPTN